MFCAPLVHRQGVQLYKTELWCRHRRVLYGGEYLRNNWNNLYRLECAHKGFASVLLWQASLLGACDGTSVFGVACCVE